MVESTIVASTRLSLFQILCSTTRKTNPVEEEEWKEGFVYKADSMHSLFSISALWRIDLVEETIDSTLLDSTLPCCVDECHNVEPLEYHDTISPSIGWEEKELLVIMIMIVIVSVLI